MGIEGKIGQVRWDQEVEDRARSLVRELGEGRWRGPCEGGIVKKGGGGGVEEPEGCVVEYERHLKRERRRWRRQRKSEE